MQGEGQTHREREREQEAEKEEGKKHSSERENRPARLAARLRHDCDLRNR